MSLERKHDELWNTYIVRRLNEEGINASNTFGNEFDGIFENKINDTIRLIRTLKPITLYDPKDQTLFYESGILDYCPNGGGNNQDINFTFEINENGLITLSDKRFDNGCNKSLKDSLFKCTNVNELLDTIVMQSIEDNNKLKELEENYNKTIKSKSDVWTEYMLKSFRAMNVETNKFYEHVCYVSDYNLLGHFVLGLIRIAKSDKKTMNSLRSYNDKIGRYVADHVYLNFNSDKTISFEFFRDGYVKLNENTKDYKPSFKKGPFSNYEPDVAYNANKVVEDIIEIAKAKQTYDKFDLI